MARTGVIVENGQVVIDKFSYLARLSPDDIRVGVGMAGNYISNLAKTYCPVRTGNLKRSITTQMVGNDTCQVGTDVYYAPFVELGTVKMAGRSYLRKALFEGKEDATKRCRQAIIERQRSVSIA